MDINLYQDPLDYPDWRLTRVKSLVGENKLPTDDDDKYIHRAFRFVKDVELSDGSNESRVAIRMKHKEMAKAFSTHNNPAERRHIIEALLLCRDAEVPDIAAYLGESPYMVTYYAKMFFDVRDHLDSPGYVCSRIFEPAIVKAVQDFKDTHIGWKMAAYFCGAKAVKECWDSTESSPEVLNMYKKMGVAALHRDFGIGTRLRPLNKWNVETVATHIMKFAELEIQANAQRGNRQSEDSVEMLRDMMSSINFFVTKPSDQVSAREPRLHELVDQSLVPAISGENK